MIQQVWLWEAERERHSGGEREAGVPQKRTRPLPASSLARQNYCYILWPAIGRACWCLGGKPSDGGRRGRGWREDLSFTVKRKFSLCQEDNEPHSYGITQTAVKCHFSYCCRLAVRKFKGNLLLFGSLNSGTYQEVKDITKCFLWARDTAQQEWVIFFPLRVILTKLRDTH